jgi:hypothetical protein
MGTKKGSAVHANAVMDGQPAGFMTFRHDRRLAPNVSPSPSATA